MIRSIIPPISIYTILNSRTFLPRPISPGCRCAGDAFLPDLLAPHYVFNVEGDVVVFDVGR